MRRENIFEVFLALPRVFIAATVDESVYFESIFVNRFGPRCHSRRAVFIQR